MTTREVINFLKRGKVKVGGQRYSILHPYLYKERFDRHGHCNFPRCEIAVGGDDGNGNPRAVSAIIITAIHEVVHAIDHDSGHDIFLDNEKALEGISHGIYQVLVDNGFLVEDK